MTPEQTQKAELTLVLMLHKLGRKQRREFCKKNDIPWGEYQYLVNKYKRITDRFDEEDRKECTTTNP